MPKREAIDENTRARIGAYLRREFLHWRSTRKADEPATSVAFADMLGIHEGTVSHVLKMTGRSAGSAGFDVALALRRRLGVAYEEMFERDPPPQYLKPVHVTRGRPFVSTGPPGPLSAEPQRKAGGKAR